MPTLPERVALHAGETPSATAVVAGGESLTYEELARRAAGIAALLEAHGACTESLVAVHLPRGTDVVAAIVGTMACGAAYTVVDHTAPAHATAASLAAAAPDLVLTTADDMDAVGSVAPIVLHPEAAPARPSAALRPRCRDGDLAYVLYTSGSTGVPKGAMVSHRNVRHYVTALLERLGITAPLAYAHVSTLAADLGNTALFLPLWTGGAVHLVADDTRRDPAELLDYLSRERIDVLKITPSHWRALIGARGGSGATAPARPLPQLILGGEALSPDVARETLERGFATTLVNHYGPTETTVGVAAHVVRDVAEIDRLDSASVPIGRPLGETSLVVLDEGGEPRSSSVTGELYIGGPSVAQGYRRDPAATRAAFLRDVRGGERFYRTGDLVSIDENGVATFLGRRDRQVKISGYRVELEQVEVALRALEEVVDAAAFQLSRDGGGALVAAALLRGGSSPAAVRARLRERLPDHMVPRRILRCSSFPRTENGKVDLRALEAIVRERFERTAPIEPTRAPTAPRSSHEERVEAVGRIWESQLGHAGFAPGTSFFDAGGTSLEAIGVIAELQARGHHVTARAFLEEPTIEALARLLAREPRDESSAASRSPIDHSELFSASQSWFFERRFADPAHWNQAICLETPTAVDPDLLAGALREVVELHPLLRTAYRPRGAGWRAEAVEVGSECFGHSRVRGGPDALAAHVREVTRSLNEAVELTRGRIFMAHLVQVESGRDQILLVCHHLSIDAISWRILVGDLARIYTARAGGGEPAVVRERAGFWDWVAHFEDHRAQLDDQIDYWREALAGAPSPPPRPASPANVEGNAETVWLALSREETEVVARSVPRVTGAQPHAAVLGAFAHALAENGSEQALCVEIETHGRALFDEELDVSRVVGWFTAAFPLVVRAQPGDPSATVGAVARALDEVPDHGAGYARCAPALDSAPEPHVSYNYLGRFDLSGGGELDLAPARHPTAPARGAANDRVHELKLTARIVEDHLVLDLSFVPGRHSRAAALRTMRRTRDLLLELVGREGAPTDQLVVEPGSSAGLLAHVPARLPLEPAESGPKVRESVLLTGATGFIGIHLLRLLLERTGAHAHCLVRARAGWTPAERLADTWRWYFGEALPADLAERVSVVAGDAATERLGLEPAGYERICAEVDAIYHLAADTRLFGDADAFEAQNVEATRNVIELASTGRHKELHHLSTLAVAGTNQSPRPPRFSEDDLDIGQGFLNEYERTKHAAERLVREFAAHGGAAYIYRTGNVSGDSRDGRFRRDGASSRVVQLLRALVRVGAAPRELEETIVLSPVDVVAEAVLSLSVARELKGGTFHVESHHSIGYADIVAALRAEGFELAESDAPDLAELFHRALEDGSEDVKLAYFWSRRGERNVSFDHSRTTALLRKLGVEFPSPDESWLRAYIRRLDESGALGAAPASAGPDIAAAVSSPHPGGGR